LQLDLEGSRVFKKLWNNKNYRIIANEGSTRSTKTYSLLQYVMTRCASEKLTITLFRKKGTWLTKTILKDFLEIRDTVFRGLGLHQYYNKTERTQFFPLTGSTISFVGLDDPQRAHGAKQDIAWFNEAMEFTWSDWKQVAQRTTRQILLDWNPNNTVHWIFDRVEKRKDCLMIHSTYKDNKWLEQAIIDEIESSEPTPENIARGTADARHWKVYGLGERCPLQGVIFENVTYINDEDFPAIEDCEIVSYGMDFGFTNPTAIVKCALFKEGLYLHEELYESFLTTLYNYAKPEQRSLQSEMERAEIRKDLEISADPNRPEIIADIKNLGYWINGFNKQLFKDSINYGIQLMNKHTIYITNSSINLKKEQENYKWAEDKDGNQLEVPVKKYDHCWDAVRYWYLKNVATAPGKFVMDEDNNVSKADEWRMDKGTYDFMGDDSARNLY